MHRFRTHHALASFVSVSMILVAACGGGSQHASARTDAIVVSTTTTRARPAPTPPTTARPTRAPESVVRIAMFDIGYRPRTPLTFPRRTTVHFVFHNTGTVPHEAVLGDATAQIAHDREMAGHGDGHGLDVPELTVLPGQTGTLTYTFAVAGRLLIGCHYPGHYAAGMRIPITITP